MATFIMLTRLQDVGDISPETIEALEREAVAAVTDHCPEVQWTASYAMLGPYDYLDVLQAPDIETATKVSMLVRRFGRAQTKIWPATGWERFKGLIHQLSAPGEGVRDDKALKAAGNPFEGGRLSSGQERKVSRDDLFAELDGVDGETIDALLTLSPTYDELSAAQNWIRGNTDPRHSDLTPPSDEALAIYDVLKEAVL